MCRLPFQILCICATCLTVIGCTTGTQKQSAQTQKVVSEPTTLGLNCVQRVAENPAYDGIKTKLYFGADNQPPSEMLTDRSHPTKQQIRLLYNVRDDIQKCRKVLLEGSAKSYPLILLTLVNSFVESDKLWVEATGGKLDWGTFNQRRKDISTQAQANLAQADAQIASRVESRNENQAQLDAEQRQRAVAAMQQWAHQQEVLTNHQRAIFADSDPRITIISCRYYGNGNTANCSLF